MGMYLNSKVPYESCKAVTSGKYFVDKSDLIAELIPALGTEERLFCITRPRRFGKSVMANMIGAFFGNAADSSSIFCQLHIAESEDYQNYQNQYNVISIDFSRIPRNCHSYTEYINRIQDGINQDLSDAYPEFVFGQSEAVWDHLQFLFEKKMEKFIFVIDEWDAPFHMSFITESDQKDYLLFLKSLLKGQAYIDLAYMTGVLPIAKYSSGSELNGFQEFDMAMSTRFGSYFGFLDSEVDRLYEKYLQTTEKPRITRDALTDWYDGYHTASGDRIYNPRSIIYALMNNQLKNYWTNSGPYDEIFYYIKHNIDAVRDDLAWMISGEGVEADMQEYAATAAELNTRDQIYSAMVVYGLLTYNKQNGKFYIPNKELMDKFNELFTGSGNQLQQENKRALL